MRTNSPKRCDRARQLHPQPGHAPASTARIWQPLFCHALQPAQHFRGRAGQAPATEGLAQAPVTPDRVDLGGRRGRNWQDGAGSSSSTRGKALGPRRRFCLVVLRGPPHRRVSARGLSYTSPARRTHPPAECWSGCNWRSPVTRRMCWSSMGWSASRAKSGHRRRGELEDLQLKRLVRALAGGVGGRSRPGDVALSAGGSRTLTGAGHSAIVLDDLERAVALDVLRAWGVKADDAALARLIEPLNVGGFYHALSVAVLGSYLGNFAAGDPSRAPEFSLEDAEESDPKAAATPPHTGAVRRGPDCPSSAISWPASRCFREV